MLLWLLQGSSVPRVWQRPLHNFQVPISLPIPTNVQTHWKRRKLARFRSPSSWAFTRNARSRTTRTSPEVLTITWRPLGKKQWFPFEDCKIEGVILSGYLLVLNRWNPETGPEGKPKLWKPNDFSFEVCEENVCPFLRKRSLLGGRVIPLPRMFTLGKQKVIPGMLSFQSLSNFLNLLPTRVCLTQKNTQKKHKDFKSCPTYA